MSEIRELRKQLKAEIIALCETWPSSAEEKRGEERCERIKAKIIAMAIEKEFAIEKFRDDMEKEKQHFTKNYKAELEDLCQSERIVAMDKKEKREIKESQEKSHEYWIARMKERWCHAFQQIDDSSWIILNNMILKQLPLAGTEQLPNDYVDKAKGFIYRLNEIQKDEEMPKVTTQVPNLGSVQADYECWHLNFCEYYIGSTARIKIMSALSPHTAREHENIAYAASKNPSFRLPQVLSHGERDGMYFILTDMPGIPRHRSSKSFTFGSEMRMRRQLIDIVAEISQWEGPSFGGVGGKQITRSRAFWNLMPSELLDTDLTPTDSVALFLKKSGFDMNDCRFLNASMRHGNHLVDDDLNFVGFRDWDHCAFVPRGFITPHVLEEFALVNRFWKSDEYCTREHVVATYLAAEVAVILNDKKIQADFTSFNAALKEKVQWDCSRVGLNGLVPEIPEDEEVVKKLQQPLRQWPDEA